MSETHLKFATTLPILYSTVIFMPVLYGSALCSAIVYLRTGRVQTSGNGDSLSPLQLLPHVGTHRNLRYRTYSGSKQLTSRRIYIDAQQIREQICSNDSGNGCHAIAEGAKRVVKGCNIGVALKTFASSRITQSDRNSRKRPLMLW
jgi:hypothetical protein